MITAGRRDHGAMTIDHTHGYDSHVRYKLSCDEMDQLLARSANQCEICRIPAAGTTQGYLMIDHDHKLGKWAVRGLLCHRCNVTIGRHFDRQYGFVARPHLRPAALSYLRRPFRSWRHARRFQGGAARAV